MDEMGDRELLNHGPRSRDRISHFQTFLTQNLTRPTSQPIGPGTRPKHQGLHGA